jgi:hypothetical protein
MLRRRFGLCLLLLALVGCTSTPEASPSAPSDEAQVPEAPAAGALEPLEWLDQIPFQPAPSEFPELVTTGLPEGFNAGEPNYVSGPHPEGFNV